MSVRRPSVGAPSNGASPSAPSVSNGPSVESKAASVSAQENNGAALDTAARLLTAGELAARWQVKKSVVYRLTREGELPTVRIGRYRRYRLAAVETWEVDGGGSG